jgi:hypothetical protein
MRGDLGRRVTLLEQRLGGVPYDGWSDSRIVERMNVVAGLIRAHGVDMPSLDPDKPEPEMLDGFIAKTKDEARLLS